MQGFGFLSAILDEGKLKAGYYYYGSAAIISRDLFWIKIVVWNYLQTDSVIILAIRFAVFVNWNRDV